MAANLKILATAEDKTRQGLKSTEGNVANLQKMVEKAAVSMGIAFGVKTIFNIAKTGAAAERAEARFEAFARDAGGAAEQLEAFQRGAGGTVSKMAAMESGARLLQMGLVSNTQEMEKVVEMATRLGNQTLSVGDRISDFALMLSNQSVPRLDNFGLSSGKVRQRILDLQKAMPGLSREAAFMQATFEQGEIALGKMGPRVDDNMASFEKLEAQVEDLGVAVGEGLAPALAVIIERMTEIVRLAGPTIKAFNEMSQGIEKGKKASDEAVQAIQAQGDEVDNLTTFAKKMADQVNENIRGQSLWNKIILDASNLARGTASEMDLIREVQEEVQRTAAANAETYREYTTVIAAYNLRIKESANRIVPMSKAQWLQASHILPRLIKESVYFDNAMLTHVKRMDNVADVTRNTGDAYVDMTGKVRDQREQWSSMVDKMMLVKAATEDYHGVMGALVAESPAMAAEIARVPAVFAAGLKDQAAEHAAVMEQMRAQQAEAVAAMNQEMIGLIDATADATEEQFKQMVLRELTKEDLGWEAYAEIGEALGILSEEQVAMAQGIQQLADAYDTGVITDSSNFAAATEDIYEAAKDLNPEFQGIIDKYADTPGKVGPAAQKQQEWNEKLIALGEEAAPGAAREIEGFHGQVDIAQQRVREAEQAAGDLEGQLTKVAKTWRIVIETEYRTIGTPPSAPGGPEIPSPPGGPQQMGGRVPGRIGQPVPVLAHGGELFANPYRYGAAGGPGGPPMPRSVGAGAPVIHNHFYDRAAYAWWADQQRRGRYERFAARVRGR